MSRVFSRSLFYSLLFVSACASAESESGQSFDAMFNVDLLGNQLIVRLEAPSKYILGFGERVTSSRQEQALMNAKATLNSPSLVVGIEPSVCSLVSKAIDTSAIYDEAQLEGGGSGSDEKTAAEDAGTEPKEGHTIVANYNYACSSNTGPLSVSLRLFRQFPSIENVRAEWSSSNAKGEAILSKTAQALLIK